MTIHELTIEKIRQLPDPLGQEVNDFVDFLLLRTDEARWQLWTQYSEGMALTESDFSDYLSNLESYEERLAAGEIRW